MFEYTPTNIEETKSSNDQPQFVARVIMPMRRNN